MGNRCAICEDEAAWSTNTIPNAWESYLRTDRGLSEPDGYYLLPACESCSEDFALQRELDPSAESPDERPTEETRELLDRVDVGELIVES